MKVLSSNISLANTLLFFFTPMKKFGRYVSYTAIGGKEHCDVVDSTKNISTYSPIIHFESEISPLKTELEKSSDKFHPIRVKDLGSLARLTYNPEFPELTNMSLYAIPHNNNWLIGYLTSIQMEETFYQFNYMELDSEPKTPFLKYRGDEGKDPEFTFSFDHGYSYLSIIKLKKENSIFGLNQI